MAHLYLGTETDSLYLDVTAGDRAAVRMAKVADGVFLHVDNDGVLVAIEVLELSRRGGLQVADLDAADGASRPALLDEIEGLTQTSGDAPRGPAARRS
jgi:uncharacterized protein YuzE